MKTYCMLLAGVALMLGSACTRGDGDFDASGTFEATEVVVSAEASGRIMAFTALEGDVLSVGQSVGYIDSVQLFLTKCQLLASAKAVVSRRPDVAKQIAAIKQQIATQQREKQRAENLIAARAGNQKQLDDINAQIDLLNKQLVAEESTLEKSVTGVNEESSALEIQVAQVEDQLQKCRIVSPVSGTVLVKYAQQGELATVGKPLFKLADVEHLFLRAYITSAQLTELKLGQSVKVFSDFGRDGRREYSGKVAWISDKSEFTPKTIQTKDERANLVYAVKIAVKNDGYLKIGMYGDMKIAE